jgi:hypothetical protein
LFFQDILDILQEPRAEEEGSSISELDKSSLDPPSRSSFDPLAWEAVAARPPVKIKAEPSTKGTVRAKPSSQEEEVLHKQFFLHAKSNNGSISKSELGQLLDDCAQDELTRGHGKFALFAPVSTWEVVVRLPR